MGDKVNMAQLTPNEQALRHARLLTFDEARFSGWFYAVMLSVHRARSRVSFWRRFLPLDEATEASIQAPGARFSPTLAEETRERAQRLAVALKALPAEQREAVVLFEVEGFSIEEIAGMQGASQTAVKTRLHRGQSALDARAAASPAQSADKEGVMKALYPVYRRPQLLTAVMTCGLLAAVLLWPVSYERTVGHTVTLTVPAASPAGVRLLPEEVRGLASRLKQAVGAGAVRVMAGGPGAPLVLTARVPSRSRKDVERQLAQLTTALQAEHRPVTSSITARTEHHLGRVYAMALDKLIDIRVDTTGKSDSQVETEIRDQLTSSGLTPDNVQFQRTADETQADIQAHDGDHTIHLMRRQRGGPSELHIEAGGLDTERSPGMTDAELREKIERQLTARGLTATVTVNGDEVKIEAHKSLGAP